ncbi:MAG: PQQ-binding-like beta-propeller repeat protein, partial [Dehalococcoidia bacterium]
SPEQIQGMPPDSRNDVYALGALAYELLTGNLPFEALNPYTVLSRQVKASPTQPSHLNETIPSALDDVVLKALRRLPEDRYASCGEMVGELEQAAGSYATMKPASATASGQQGAPAEVDSRYLSDAAELEEGRVVCPNCGNGNSASASRCQVCWGTLKAQPVLTVVEEERLVHRYVTRLRRQRRLTRGVIGGLLAALLVFWIYNLFEIRPPLPAPSSTINSQSAAGEWSMTQRDVRHTGTVPGPSFKPEGSIKWQFESQGPILATPAAAGDMLYVATSDYRVVALDAATGREIWTHPVRGPVNSPLTIAGDLVFVGMRDWNIIALDAKTGDLRWSFKTKNPIYGSATVLDGSLYVGSSDRHIYSLDASTGELRWDLETEGWVIASPAIDQGIVVVGDQRGEIYMVDASNGTLRNQVQVSRISEVNTVTLVDDAAYFTTSKGVIAFRYTQKDTPFQKGIWTIWLNFFLWKMAPQPAPIPGFLWAVGFDERVMAEMATADGRLFAATANGSLHALDLETGERLWEAEGLGQLFSSPMVSGDEVIQASYDGTIYGFDVSTGEQRWAISVAKGITTSPILADDTLYVPTIFGTLYAIR